MKENLNDLKNGLGIDEWLELIKEDKNLNSAYISIAQYIYLIEKENQETKELLHKIMISGVEEENTTVLDLYNENKELRKKIKVYEDPEDLTLMFMYCNEKTKDKIKELEEQLEVGKEQYNDLVEEKEKLDAENQVLKNNKNEALRYMKNYLQMELRYQNKDVAEHFKIVIDTLNRGNKHGNLVDITDYETQQKEFIKWLEDEKDRLIKGTSHYYIDSFDRQHAVNETVYDEVDIILQKCKKIIGVSDENTIK